MITEVKIRSGIFGLVFLATAGLSLHQTQAQDEQKNRVGVLFDGVYDKADISRKIKGAKNTQLVAAREWNYGVKHFSKEEWAKRGMKWETFFVAAKIHANEIIDRLEPKLVRDSRNVIEYAVIRDKDPFLSSIIVTPGFLKIFADTLGDNLHVVIVDRNLLYVFPAAGGKLNEYGPAIVNAFRSAPMRVSLEVFLVNKQGFSVVGELERG